MQEAFLPGVVRRGRPAGTDLGKVDIGVCDVCVSELADRLARDGRLANADRAGNQQDWDARGLSIGHAWSLSPRRVGMHRRKPIS